jgi:Mrp family chromosome partitioning ATPase
LEPISYLRAPIRRWPVVVSVALVALIVALLVPVSSSSAYPPNTWKTASTVGLTPSHKGNALGAKLGLNQLEFYAQEPAVLAAAARADGVNYTKKLQADVVVTKAKGKGKGGGGIKKQNTLQIAVLQQTKSGAVSLTNAFVAALSSYAQLQLANQHKNAIATQEAYIANLEKALANLPKPVKKPKPPTTTTTHPTTTTTHPPVVVHHHHKKKKKAERIRVGGTGATHPRASSTSATLTASAGQDPVRVQLVDTVPTVTTQLTPATTVGGGATAPSTLPGGATLPTTPIGGVPTTPTTQNLPKKTLQEENRVLSEELARAIGTLQKLNAAGVTPAGIRLIEPAVQKGAVKLNPKSPLLSNAFVRGLLGLVVGILLGVVATWLLDAFDRRLRSSKRAEAVFGLPVIVEIPGSHSESASAIPVVDVIVDPYSPASEAYRRLHVAILTAPSVTWVRRGYGYQEEPLELAPLRSSQNLLVGAAAPGGAAQAPGVPGSDPHDLATGPSGQMNLPVPLGPRDLVRPTRSRFSILVTAPTDEPTRSLVVVNLAAVFAEAGDRVLVATTGGMRTSIDGNGKLPPTWDGPYSDLTASELVANARPSQIPGVSSLALGQLFPNPSKLALNAPRLVEAARDVVDVVLFEAPILSTQDGTALLPAADLVVVVCEAWHTTVNDGQQTQRLLAQHRPPVLGLVMTNMRADHPSLTAAP